MLTWNAPAEGGRPAARLPGRAPNLVARATAPAAPADRYEPAVSDARAKALAADVVAAWRGLPGMTGTSEVVACRGAQVLRRQVIAASYQAPGTVDLRVEQGEGAGARIRWAGGPTAQVQKFGCTFAWPLDHKRLANPHGWTLRDTAPGMVIRMLADPGTQVRGLRREGGLEVIEAISPASPAGVSREELAIDPARKLIVERRLYGAAGLMGRSTVQAFTPGAP